MKKTKWLALAFFAAVSLAFTGCSTAAGGDSGSSSNNNNNNNNNNSDTSPTGIDKLMSVNFARARYVANEKVEKTAVQSSIRSARAADGESENFINGLIVVNDDGSINTKALELSAEIKKAVGGKSKKYSKQVDAYLDSSWEDIIGILKAQNGGENSGIGGATIEEIRSVIEDVLRTSRLNVNVAGVTAAPVLRQAQEPQEVEDIEEVEALDEAEPV